MNKEIIDKYSVYRKQSKVGALVFLFDSIRKNAVNFLFILVPTGFDLLVFIIVSLVFVFILSIYDTAGGATTDINIKGLKLETAQKFKTFVSEKIEKIDKK